MSLRFERKGSLRKRRERSEESMSRDRQYFMSWSYRQCQFACDYLNLMENAGKVPAAGGNVGGNLEPVHEGVAGISRARFGSFRAPSSNAGGKSLNQPRMRSSIAACNSLSSRVSFSGSTTSGYAESVSSYASSSSSSRSSYGFDFERDMEQKPADPFRFSQATLEDTQEDELNAILGELSALQMSLDQDIANKQSNLLRVPEPREVKPIGGGGGSSTNSESGVRTESPDNDSGFSDNASLLSSGSSLSASGSSSGSSTTSCHINKSLPQGTNVIPASELAALVSSKLCSLGDNISDEKAQKIREALAKIRAANVTRLYVKAFSPDGSSKALMVEETMSCSRVLNLLADKNHVPLSPKWALVEHIPHLHMERIYEDHESMVENLLMWTRDSKNKIFFVERDDKYDMFLNPQRYFLERRLANSITTLDDHTKNGIIDEFFNQGVGVPDVESTLYLKAEGKKAWKKFAFVLRASGIYYYPKGRSHANSSKDLACLATLDPNQEIYQGVGWKKKFKAPTEYGFVLKPARLQVKSHRHMKYLCAEDAETLRQWMVGLRIAKHKRQLWDNYRALMEDIAHEDLDRFGRSVSLASMPIQINTKETEMKVRQAQESIYSTTNNMRPESAISQISHTSVPSREEGFESDCPVGGTIKRKPSTVLQPKIPLTINTRSIVGDYISVANPTEGPALAHTLQRRRSSSGNSGTGSTASSNSSLASINSQPSSVIQNSQQSGRTKPTANPRPPPATVEEEPADTVDFESLPPPPPELLIGAESDLPTTPCIITGAPPPPPLPLSAVAPPPPGLPPCPPSGNLKAPGSTGTMRPKKGVSFASELTQRLQSRNGPSVNIGSESVVRRVPQPQPLSPKKLEDPPQDFLTDLQRVMQKKWQVAQKCGSDRNTTPHEILGFRLSGENLVSLEVRSNDASEEVPIESLNNVRAWVSQHYGSADEIPPVIQQQIPPQLVQPPQQQPETMNSPVFKPIPPMKPIRTEAVLSGLPPPPPDLMMMTPPATPQQIYAYPNANLHNNSNNQQQLRNSLPKSTPGVVIYENFQGRKNSQNNMMAGQYPVQLRNKKPPPPIPKRSESTHLSAHIVYN